MHASRGPCYKIESKIILQRLQYSTSVTVVLQRTCNYDHLKKRTKNKWENNGRISPQ